MARKRGVVSVEGVVSGTGGSVGLMVNAARLAFTNPVRERVMAYSMRLAERRKTGLSDAKIKQNRRNVFSNGFESAQAICNLH